jgi:hypothetical protein
MLLRMYSTCWPLPLPAAALPQHTAGAIASLEGGLGSSVHGLHIEAPEALTQEHRQRRVCMGPLQVL